jgi:hypothetical protein
MAVVSGVGLQIVAPVDVVLRLCSRSLAVMSSNRNSVSTRP